jgi:O-antigen/teichoic acid export membrane protein
MQLTVTKLVIVAVIFNIVLNLLVIPIYSYIGAAIVTVLTEALILILFVYTLKSEFSVSRSTKINLIKGVLASIIMGIAIYYFNNLNLFLIILLGALIYVVCLILLRVLDDDEILMIKSLFNRS